MSDKQYQFDPETLSYKVKETNKGRRLLVSFFMIAMAILTIATTVFLLISYTLKTPKQKMLENENYIMEQQYELVRQKYNHTHQVLEDIKERDKDLYKAIFETDPPETHQENYLSFLSSDSVTNENILNHIKNKNEILVDNIKHEEQFFQELQYVLTKPEREPRYTPSIHPLVNGKLKYIPYGFGKKLDPINKVPKIHYGIDFAAPIGTEVMATADGQISYVGKKRDEGLEIIINHKGFFKTSYQHLSGVCIKNNQKVKRGEVIGFVGNDGRSIMPHLHYEIEFNNKKIDPVLFMFEDIDPSELKKLEMLSKEAGLCLD